jgi:hypothetical protein
MSDAEEEAAEEEAEQRWHDHRAALMEELLGKEHDLVGHSVVPYALGGSLDLHYYPNGLAGTAIATQELAEEGTANRVFRCYELVMFTRHPVDLVVAKDVGAPFGQMHKVISAFLNVLAPYSAKATLNPNDTCEFPADIPTVGGRCMIFDGYPSYSDDCEPAEFGLLVVIEVFRSEMEYACRNGGGRLLERLKAKGHYPYSDLFRQPVA